MGYRYDPLKPRREGGKSITVGRADDSVPVIVWGKKGAPVLVLDLTPHEAGSLRDMLDAALVESR